METQPQLGERKRNKAPAGYIKKTSNQNQSIPFGFVLTNPTSSVLFAFILSGLTSPLLPPSIGLHRSPPPEVRLRDSNRSPFGFVLTNPTSFDGAHAADISSIDSGTVVEVHTPLSYTPFSCRKSSTRPRDRCPRPRPSDHEAEAMSARSSRNRSFQPVRLGPPRVSVESVLILGRLQQWN